ncbi:MAG: efflux RND transporter periplasmic adaptor subunit [Myxococcales bacterium]
MALRFICTGFLFTLLACKGGTTAPSPQAPEVTTTTPTVKTITEWDEYTGRVAALHAVEIRARVTGYVQEIRFRDGAMVDEGELLMVIDPRPYEATLRAAQARLEKAKAQLETTSLLLKRAQSIRDSGAVSRDTLDERLNNHLVAKAELAAAQADVASARLDLAFTKVRAPIAGQVGRRLVEQGDLVEAGGAASTLLTTVVSQDPVYFYFTINERDALYYGRLWRKKEGKGNESIVAHLLDDSGTEHLGHIDFVDNQIDAASGTRELRAVFDNPDGSLVPGMFGTIRIAHGDPHEAMLIPKETIMTDQAIEFVYVVGTDDVVERRDLELGPEFEGMRVVRNGLSADSRIIVKGMQRARPGSPVSPTAQSSQEAASEKSGPRP